MVSCWVQLAGFGFHDGSFRVEWLSRRESWEFCDSREREFNVVLVNIVLLAPLNFGDEYIRLGWLPVHDHGRVTVAKRVNFDFVFHGAGLILPDLGLAHSNRASREENRNCQGEWLF